MTHSYLPKGAEAEGGGCFQPPRESALPERPQLGTGMALEYS